MGDQGEYSQNDQQNYEESYESDIQKKFERELQNMERSRQKETYNGQEDYNDGYQNEQNQDDDQQNYNNEDQGEEYNQQQEEYNQEGGNDGEFQDQDPNVENNQQDQSYEQQHQQDYDQQNQSQMHENSQNLPEENHDNFDNEEVSKKVETHQNDDGSITTVTYTTVTKTKKIDLQDYSMPTIEEQDTDKITKHTRHGLSKEKSQSPNQNKNIFNSLDEVSQQKLIIKSLKEELKDEREINTIQALEIESLKQLVRKLQGNIETLQLQIKGEQNTQQMSSPQKSENSKRNERIFNQVKIYQSMEVKNTKQDTSITNKTQNLKNNEQEEMGASENGQQNQEKIYLTTFQKSLWIPQKEKMAEKQLYETPVQEQEQKLKTLRPLKKITPKDKQQLQQSKINKDQNSQSDIESKSKKKTDASVFDEELSKIAKQNKEQFAAVYKQNKLKLRQEMFEDYQKRKQELLEKRENRNRLDANWQESLHPVSRAKSVKNISVNVFNMSDKQHRHDLRTPSYMERQMQTIQKEMDKINSKSISNLPTLENGYSPNSISSIAAGNNLKKQIEIKSSISIPNISQSPDNQFSKSQVSKKKLFLYQITDADKNYLLKSHQYKHLKLSKEELKQQQENIENLKEKHKEEELQKLERYNQLKVSPEYCLMRKNSEEIRRSQVQSAKSNHRKSQEQHSSSQIRVSYPALSGLLSQNINMNQSNNLDKDQFLSSSTSSKVVVKGNPYSLESNPQKEEPYPPTPKKKVKSQIITTQITTTNATQSVQHPGINNPYVISSIKKSKDGNNPENNIWENDQDQQQKKSASQDNGKVQINQITYTTTSTTRNNNKNEKQDQPKKEKQQQNNSDDGNNISNKQKGIEKPVQDRRNTDQNSQSDTNEKANSLSQDEKNKVPIGNYKIQQHEYNELFQKGKFNNDHNKKQINWDDKIIKNKNDPKNKLNAQLNDKNNQNTNQQQQQQQKQPQIQQNYQNRVQNTYFQQKYSTQQPQNQIQQTKQPPQQVQPNNQQIKKQMEQQNKNNSNQQPQNQKPNQQQPNLNNSMNKSQVSKNSQQNQDSNRGSDSNKSASPKQNVQNNYQYNQYAEDQSQQQYEQDYQDQDYIKRPSSNNKQDSDDESDREKYNNQYNSDYNKMQGMGNLQGVQGKFTQFNAQGQQVAQNQKPQIQKREPKVREQPPPPKKSEFVEKLEKEAQKDSKVEVRDEKVYLKPIESDDEPMFGYDSSGQEEEEEEEQPKQNTQKRSSIKQTNSVSNNQKKRVSLKREEEDYEYEEEEEENEAKYRKTPRTPFNQNQQDEDDQYN
ncbi:hypothetical protein TTHERM_00852750 (macronuclear) [Tetrahymena thermophila SB210]|uniref:Uncharacterized protein n=1 Tax=Tetrahymena thermophila (strain SB210) TaxID=312017 RepID=Q24E65_TETTS|nr:hypothetical protein TTHERM_00852750 [Tetrahymena thermophila SB210]EAS06036.2 hypothetical protein TTHERM_00852750 [Tetrahymena thermophila SB210]|eukprot:XP_001026281.2 hypothetical protein TTHERM_00852750 [Tetrahymena thermophila SB210]